MPGRIRCKRPAPTAQRFDRPCSVRLISPVSIPRSGPLFLAFAFVVAAFGALSIAPAARLDGWSHAAFRQEYLIAIIVWGVVAFSGQVIIARWLPRHDPLIFPIVMFLSGWGLALVWRLAPAFGMRQATWLLVSAIGLVAVVVAPGDLRWLRRYRYLWLTLALGLTALTLLIGINPSGGGPALWLGFSNMFFQPSEGLKLLFVVFLAAYLAERISLTNPSDSARQQLVFLAPLLLVWGLSLVILVSQRDLGTGSIIFVVFIAMLYLATGQRWYVVIGGLLLLLSVVLSYLLFDVVRLRVDAWVNPFVDPAGRSFQIVQSLIAVANGGLFGRGFGAGAPTVIPVVHSDFVFAAILEEWGLLGGVATLALIALFLSRGLRLAFLARGSFRRLLAGGLATLLGLQTVLIVGGVIKVLPLTGVTLPFMSYGGSSLLFNFLATGLLLKLSDDANQ
jgi:cell division protein FtsW (lipid II flippase)